jgi:hypothetical protein
MAPKAQKPPLRIRRPPQYEPPFDDERPTGHEVSPDQLALNWPAKPGTRTAPATTSRQGSTGRSATPAPQGVVGSATPAEQERTNSATPAGRGGTGSATPAGQGVIGGVTAAGAGGLGRREVASDPARIAAAMVDSVTDERREHPDDLTRNGLGRAARMAVIAARAATVEPPRNAVGATGKTRPRTPADPAGDARLAVRHFVNACVEVFNGYRPAAHLRRLSQPAEAGRVVAQAMAGAHRVRELRGPDQRQPIPRARRRPTPVAVLKVQLCEPRTGAVEASIVLVTGERTWALALRMETYDQAWVATALRLV